MMSFLKYVVNGCEPEGEKYQWIFQHGTIVRAHTYDAAVKTLRNLYTRNYWASETFPGEWDVQFDEDTVVEGIKAETMPDAVKTARFFLLEDTRSSRVVKSTFPNSASSTYRYRD